MRTISCPLSAAATCALLAACTLYEAPVQPLPAGPTSEEVADYDIAQAQYRYGQSVGNGDDVTQALCTFSQIPGEILSRQDPRLVAAQVECERYRVAAPYNFAGMRTTYEPEFRYACTNVQYRYTAATAAIRKDLEAKIAAADLATIAQVRAGQP